VIAALSLDSANDAVTALLAILVASMLRVIWSLQQRISRLEGIDEGRERFLDRERGEEGDDVRPGLDHPEGRKEH
jgi:hypothetical protein